MKNEVDSFVRAICEEDTVDRRGHRRRVFAAVGVAGLLSGLLVAVAAAPPARMAVRAAFTASPAAATPVSPSTSSCTYNGSPSAVLGVAAGTSVSISCTGLPASASIAVVQASGLAGVASPSNAVSGFVDTSHLVIASSDATGAFSATFVVHATGDATNPFTPTNGDANATCPPSQAQINSGLVGCAIALASVATQAELNAGTLVFASQAAPASPTLALIPNANVFPGNALTASDAAATGHWWGAPLTGAPNAAAGVPGFTTTVGGVTATNNLSASPAAYCTGVAPAAGVTPSPLCSGVAAGSLVPPALSGSITVPTPQPPNGTVVVTEPNTTPVGTPTSVQASATITFQTTAPTLTTSPQSGGCGPFFVSLSGANWNPQGGAVTVAFSVANSGQTVDSVSLTPTASGTINGTITGNPTKEALGSNPLVATQGTLTATAPFTLSAFACGICSASGTAPNNAGSCSLQEPVIQTVTGDPLGITLSDAAPGATPPTVTMSPVILNGKVQTTTGKLAPVTLDDNRGTLVGWSLTAQFNSDNFACTGAGGAACPGAHSIDNTIPASNMLLVTPSVACTDAGNPATVPATPPSCVISEVTQPAGHVQVHGPSGAATSLGTAAAGGGGGGFTANSPVSLLLPPYIAGGTYSNVLNITVT
jgi:hypothetical protein